MKVSICIPAYNQTVFLKKSLDSICEQTYTNFEVVITDDSSTSDVEKLVKEYESKLTIRYQKNTQRLGSPANWNRALDLAKGELIKFVHHDDWLAFPYSLEKFVQEFLKNKDLELAFCSSQVNDIKHEKSHVHEPSPSFLRRMEKDSSCLFNNNQVGSPTAVMFKNNGQRFDEKMKYLVDIDFYVRLLHNHRPFAFIKEPLIVNTSNHEEQVTTASLNKATQLGEYTYLYKKMFQSKIPSLEISLFFMRLFKKYEVKDLREIVELNQVHLDPSWYFRFLLFVSKFKS